MYDYLAILKRNFLVPVVITIFTLAIILLILGEKRDALFISFVITVNTLFAVFQEIRAMRALKKLELMSRPRAVRIINNDPTKTEEVLQEALAKGDQIILKTGDDVPADVQIIESKGLEINESLLTGEADSVEKKPKDKAFAASSVVAGEAIAKVLAVGDESMAGGMSAKLKRYEPSLTPLQAKLQYAISFLTVTAIILSFVIIVSYWLIGRDPVSMFKTIAAAGVTVVPEGLLLASSLLLAFGSLKLASQKVLPQKLSAIEAMALLDVLCVDKTGTLTSPDIEFNELRVFNGIDKDDTAAKALVVAQETSGGNATGKAIIGGLSKSSKTNKDYEVLEVMAFSSARKMSAVRFMQDGKKQTVFMGAPDYVAKLASLNKGEQDLVNKASANGLRVLLLASFNDDTTPLKKMKKSGRALGIVVLSNELRDGVSGTVEYLQSKDVQIKVISGDGQKTVQYVAKEAGIDNYQKAITGEKLAKLSKKEQEKAIASNSIFTRILPKQKEDIISVLQKQGHFAGMVGDGVNDALALKKADLGVAMFSGSAVSRRVSDIVLLNNSFTALPSGMKLGNRIMLAIENIATLFFNKIIFGMVLLVSTLVLLMPYPIMPRNVTFLNVLLVTSPTIMWTLFLPKPARRLNPQNFWRDTLWSVLPIAIISGVVITIVYLAEMAFDKSASAMEVSTLVVIAAGFFGVNLVYMIPYILGEKKTLKMRLVQLLYTVVVIVVIAASFGIGFIRKFFDFETPTGYSGLLLATILILAVCLQWVIALKRHRAIMARARK